jgi:predicted AlkP superfamily pyrophosphatase or phosphodiesterase
MKFPSFGGCVFAAVLLAASATGSGAPRQAPERPQLVVVIVVDQMRVQYLNDYRPLFTKGFDRLLKQGAWFREGAYPYLNTVTCVGHSTIGTGTFPYRHGMILNAWYERETKTSPTCTADPSATEFSYSGLKPIEGDSSKRLLRPTLAEYLRRGQGRTVALSLKPRSTVPVVGREADAIAWFDDRGGWMTSLVYGPPSKPLQAFITAHPPAADFRKVWRKALGASAYRFEDDAPEEKPIVGWERTFPHPLKVKSAHPDVDFYTRWQRSPYSDEYLGRMAAAIVDSMRLGRGPGVDFLSVSFSALDLVGHAYGPRSHEAQDILVRLDATLGRLLDHLDAKVGRGRYVLALSADHGVSDIPEQTTDGGRLPAADVKAALQKVLVGAMGPGEYVASNQYTDHYLSPAAAERVEKDEPLRSALLAALRSLPGVQQAYYGPDLATPDARASSDPMTRAAALGYYPGRSGDLIMVPRRHWLTSTAATSHGTSNDYDQHVPVMLFGAGIKSGTYDQPATPADLAPTLGAVVGVTMPDVDGRVLSEALTRPPRSETGSGEPDPRQ